MVGGSGRSADRFQRDTTCRRRVRWMLATTSTAASTVALVRLVLMVLVVVEVVVLVLAVVAATRWRCDGRRLLRYGGKQFICAGPGSTRRCPGETP